MSVRYTRYTCYIHVSYTLYTAQEPLGHQGLKASLYSAHQAEHPSTRVCPPREAASFPKHTAQIDMVLLRDTQIQRKGGLGPIQAVQNPSANSLLSSHFLVAF
jgi:hypothetical protein